MKSKAFLFAALALSLLLAGCRKETVLPEPPASIRFTAEIGALTRTTLDGVRVLWESGDELDIISGAGVVTYVATPDASDARKAVFTKKNPSDPEPVPLPDYYGIGKYAALYPAGLVTMESGIPIITLPSTQHYQSPGNIKDMNVMFASTETLSFSFQNAMGLLELTIKGDKTLTSISVQTKETPISGLVDLMTMLPYSGTAVTLDCGSGVALTPEGTRFYIGFPALTVPLGELSITAHANDGSKATLVNRGGAATFQAGHISPYTWTPSFEAPEGIDWYGRFTAGQDLVIGGKTYNKSTHPSYALVRLSQLSAGSDLAAYLGGSYDVVFLDYVAADAGVDKLTVRDANLAPADGVALVGRYSDHHSELVFEGKSLTPQGSLALKNVCVRSNTNALTTASMTVSGSRLDIEDCAFYLAPNENAAGSLVYDSKSTSPLGSFALKNSVVVRSNDYNHALFRSIAYGTVPYADFVIENNALVYTSGILGKESCTSNLFTLSTDTDAKNSTLEFTFRNNSVLGYKGSGTILATCDPKAIVCEDNVLDQKLTSAIYLLNIYYPYSKLSAETSSVGGNYCNNSGGFISGVDFANGDALKARFAVPTPNRFEYGLTPFSLVDTAVGYLGLIPSLAGKGCSYETKLWRSWAGDSGGNSESYGEGHGSDEFGWQ
ncbi:MAG: hypothetical protein II851_03860 [Bacteroidales bacterium]|nr:hypothetical protein [Bacteroidales bacterium]